jgi:hypothetical protein
MKEYEYHEGKKAQKDFEQGMKVLSFAAFSSKDSQTLLLRAIRTTLVPRASGASPGHGV